MLPNRINDDICISFRWAVLAKAAFSPFGCFSQVICPCKNSQSKRRNQPRQCRLNSKLQGIMKIKLNVRVNLTKECRLFTVWPKTHQFLPGVEFYTGNGTSTAEAIEDLFASLPEEFAIDDEFAVRTTSLILQVIRPFEVFKRDIL